MTIKFSSGLNLKTNTLADAKRLVRNLLNPSPEHVIGWYDTTRGTIRAVVYNHLGHATPKWAEITPAS